MTKTEELNVELLNKLEELFEEEARKKAANDEMNKRIKLLEGEIHAIVQEIRSEESGSAALPFEKATS